MSDVSVLLERIDAEFSALEGKIKRAQDEKVQEHCSIARAGLVAWRKIRPIPARDMTKPAPAPPALHPVRWLTNQPYLLLSLMALFWAMRGKRVAA